MLSNEAIQEFLLHVMPLNFMKIRYLRFLSHRNKKQAVNKLMTIIKEIPNQLLDS